MRCEKSSSASDLLCRAAASSHRGGSRSAGSAGSAAKRDAASIVKSRSDRDGTRSIFSPHPFSLAQGPPRFEHGSSHAGRSTRYVVVWGGDQEFPLAGNQGAVSLSPQQTVSSFPAGCFAKATSTARGHRTWRSRLAAGESSGGFTG